MAFDHDDVALKLGAKQPDGTIVHEEAVTFRGWLGPGEGAGATNYRLYVSPWGERWLELRETDIVHQQPGSQSQDGSSILWVKAEARITSCRTDKAFEIAKKDIDDPDDPTVRARIPKY